MNYIDLLLFIIVLLSVLSGWQRGFIAGFADLFIMAASLVAAFRFYPYVAGFMTRHVASLGVWTIPLSFILVVILARILLSLLIAPALNTLPAAAHTNVVNRVLGIIPGFINGLIYAIIVSALLLSIPLSDQISTKTRESAVAGKLATAVEWLDDKFSPVFDEAIQRTMNKLTVEPGSEKSIDLRFKVTDPKVREDLEAKMLVLVNNEREKQGLKPVKADPELTLVARVHSRDMFARGYFSHISPEGKSPFDRMKKAKVKFLTAGENLALGQTLSICHTGLMNSPGHRANILNPAFGRLGIGILDGGMYGLMISQEFRN